jgi:hypothetical protein
VQLSEPGQHRWCPALLWVSSSEEISGSPQLYQQVPEVH